MYEIKVADLIGKGYDDFWNCEKRYRVLKGGKGSKKSSVTALNLIYRLMKYPKSNLLVIRAVMNTHRNSTFAVLSWAQKQLRVEKLWSNSLSNMEMTYLPTGQKIIFRGTDDVLKLAGLTVDTGYINFVWIEEAFEITKEEDFDKLDLTVPRGKLSDGLFKQTTITFNPWSSEHWLKRRFFDIESDSAQVFTTNYLCNEFLDDTDRLVFERMKKNNARKYAVAGLGEWGVAEGLVFENWSVEHRKITSNGTWKAFFGLDYGYTNDPTAFIAFYVNPKTMEIHIFDEFYKTRMLNSDIAREIKKRGFSKERIRADSAEPKSNEDLRRMGISRILPASKGADSILNGISRISEYKITVEPHCIHAVAELNSYHYKTDANSNPKRLPEDSDNHLMDALRYAFEDVKYFKEDSKAYSYSDNSLLLKEWI
ncbi:MAG: PBSX family phage terminase large subunit [Ruminococcaceae bacterium]|nr:PBSX family phage terminase large subunit [Oscillospiraceae bacterium]